MRKLSAPFLRIPVARQYIHLRRYRQVLVLMHCQNNDTAINILFPKNVHLSLLGQIHPMPY